MVTGKWPVALAPVPAESLTREVKAWLQDMGRMAWALFYWNARKSAFVLRGRSGQCPCHNPSDSGEAMATECEAVLSWNNPARFRRVCPLLARSEAGRWVCRVRAAEVRPFWGRALGYAGGTCLAVMLVAGIGLYGFMRGVGYEVTWRQIIWPRAWSELNGVRAQFFIKQAEAHYAAGRTREAMAALQLAVELEPDNFRAGMMLAQLYQAGPNTVVDPIYAHLLQAHPEQGDEINRAWFRSLLGRGRLAEVAALARRQLAAEPAQAAVWTNALIYSAAHLHRPDWLEEAASAPAIPASARTVLALAGKVARAQTGEAKRTFLVQTPLAADFPYDRVYRARQLIAVGFPRDALGLLAASTDQLGGRDIARLALSAYAAMGDKTRLAREFEALLGPGRALSAAELSLLALHLMQYPDPDLLAKVVAAIDRVAGEPMEVRIETYITLFCAAGVQGNEADMRLIQQHLVVATAVSPKVLHPMGLFFISAANGRIQPTLPALSPLTLECTYAFLDRYLRE